MLTMTCLVKRKLYQTCIQEFTMEEWITLSEEKSGLTYLDISNLDNQKLKYQNLKVRSSHLMNTNFLNGVPLKQLLSNMIGKI